LKIVAFIKLSNSKIIYSVIPSTLFQKFYLVLLSNLHLKFFSNHFLDLD